MAGKQKRAHAYKRRNQEDATIRGIDELARYEAFKAEIAPQLQKDLENGLTAQEIFAKYKPYAAARTVTIALTEPDSGKAKAAAADILDRTDGKAKESKEVIHKLQNLPEDQLDALLLSKLGDGADDDSDTIQ